MTALAHTPPGATTRPVTATELQRASVYIGNVNPGQTGSGFTDSLAQLAAADIYAGWGCYRGKFAHASAANVSKARNDVVRDFLATDGEWLLFLDSDMVFPQDTHVRLLASAQATGAKIIGGLCVMVDAEGVAPTLYRRAAGAVTSVQLDFPDDTILQVYATGTACLMVHREVLEARQAAERENRAWLDEHADDPIMAELRERDLLLDPSESYGWFQERARRDRWVSEDVEFCLGLGRLGYPIYVDCTLKIGHQKFGRIWTADDIRRNVSLSKRPIVAVIPTKDRDDLLLPLVSQIVEQGEATEIVVVDNGMKPEARQGLEGMAAPVSVLDGVGMGIHEMWNAGIDHAIDHHGRSTHIALLNDDLHIGPGFLGALSRALESDNKLAAVSGNYDGRTAPGLVQEVRDICAGRYDGSGGLAGFAFMVKAGWFTGGYRFPVRCKWWYGDNDLVLAVAAVGGKVGIALGAAVTHIDGGGQTGGDWSDKVEQLQRDREAFEERWRKVREERDRLVREIEAARSGTAPAETIYGGVQPVEGGSMEPGRAYHDIPGEPGPVHRRGSQERADHIAAHLDVQDRPGVDIGCAVGGLSIALAERGARMVGIDYDQASIGIANRVARRRHLDAAFFTGDLTSDETWETILGVGGGADFAVWLSQWMWLAKQVGPDAARGRLEDLSESVPVLVFETAQGSGDGMAGTDDVVGPGGVRELLRTSTSYRSIIDIGPGPGRWEGDRHVFVCRRDPLLVTGTVAGGFGAATRDVEAGVYGDRRSLGYEPYPGTLNLQVEPGTVDRLGLPHRTVTCAGIERRLWPVSIYLPPSTAVIEGHLMSPRGPNTNEAGVELLAPTHLRVALQVDDGDQVTVEIWP